MWTGSDSQEKTPQFHETVGSKGEPIDTKFQVDRRSQHGIFHANKASKKINATIQVYIQKQGQHGRKAHEESSEFSLQCSHSGNLN